MRGDLYNKWAVICFGHPERSAGFKDGSAFGWGFTTPQIYSALKGAAEGKSLSEARNA
jgi:hypothetical protein